MSNKITSIKVVAKNKEEVFYQVDVGQTVDIIYKTKEPLSQMEIVKLAPYPNSLIRALGGMASLLGGMFVQKTVNMPDDCDLMSLEAFIFSEGIDKPDTQQIKCTGAAIIPAADDKMKMTDPTDVIFIGMDSREAIGALQLIEFQQLISSSMSSFLQQMAAMQQQMMGRGPGPGGQDLRNLLKKPRQ